MRRVLERANIPEMMPKISERGDPCANPRIYYTCGVLHSPKYRRRSAANLKKEFPLVPLTEEFAAFSLDLVKRVVRVSMETIEIVGSLPSLHVLPQPTDWPFAWKESS